MLNTCDLQNGFKEHGSTNACTFMVNETIQYYLQKDSNVYGTVLDATKPLIELTWTVTNSERWSKEKYLQ